MNGEWLENMHRGIHLDFHMPEFPREAIKNFDAKAHVKELKRIDTEVVAVFTKCHFGNSFYNTKVGHKHSGLEKDYFGEVLEECHKQNIKVLAYYSLGTDEFAVKHNPDWYQVDESGYKRDGNGTVWQMPCINSPYREELVIPQIKEIVNNYNIDGLYIDIPYIENHICFCRSCKRKFKLENGTELNEELYKNNRDSIIEFGMKSAAKCLSEIRETVKESKDIPIIINGAWKMGEPEIVNLNSDIGAWESQPANGSYLYSSIKSRYARSLNRPMFIQTVRFTEGWGLMSSKTVEQLKYEAATIMANGGNVNIGDQVMPDGTLQKGAYDILEEVFKFIKERERFTLQTKSLPHIALIADYTSKRYWDDGEYSTLGASKMLIEGHQQFDIYYNNNFKEISNYKIVILTETVKLNADSLQTIQEFVRKGGLLIASQNAILNFDKNTVEELFGLQLLEYSTYSFAYMTMNKDLWRSNASIPQLVDGDFMKLYSKSAEILSNIQWPCGESIPPKAFRHPMPPPGEESSYPAISINNFGKGKVLFFSGPIFRSYWNTNHFWIKNIFNNSIDLYDNKKPYYIEAPPNIEVTMTENNNKKYLHLINYQASHTGNRKKTLYDPIEQINPIHDLKIKLKGKIDKVILQPDNIDLSFQNVNEYNEIVIPKIHIYSILEIITS